MCKLYYLLAFGSISVGVSTAQITIPVIETLPDHGATRNYRVNAGTDPVPITESQWLAIAPDDGGPMNWDFTNAPSEASYDYTYVDVSGDSVIQTAYPGATIGEGLTIDGSADPQWTAFSASPDGKRNHGFYSTDVSTLDPEIPFDSPLLELPSLLQYDAQWEDDAQLMLELAIEDPFNPGEFETVHATVDVHQTGKVDAWGCITLPNHGTIDALRIQLLSRSVTTAYFPVEGLPDFPIEIEDTYIRTYAWYARDIGIVASVVSMEETAPPAEIFAQATRILHLSSASGFRLYIHNLEHRLTDTHISLSWDGPNFETVFRIDSSITPGEWTPTQSPETESESFMLPISGDRQFYRVVAVHKAP